SAATAPGAEGEHHHRPHRATRTEVELGVGCGVRVVLDPDGKTETLGHAAAEVDAVAERDVDRLPCTAALTVDRRRDPEAERDELVGQQLLDSGIQASEQLVLRAQGRRMLAAALGTALTVDDASQDLGADEVHAE